MHFIPSNEAYVLVGETGNKVVNEHLNWCVFRTVCAVKKNRVTGIVGSCIRIIPVG